MKHGVLAIRRLTLWMVLFVVVVSVAVSARGVAARGASEPRTRQSLPHTYRFLDGNVVLFIREGSNPGYQRGDELVAMDRVEEKPEVFVSGLGEEITFE